MNKSGNAYFNHFLALLSGNFLSQLVPFLVAPVLARLFLPEQFAVLANFMAIVNLIGVVATGRLEIAIPLPESKKIAQNLVFSALVINIGVVLISGMIPFFADSIAAWYHDPELAGFLWFVPLAVLGYGLLGIFTNWTLRSEMYRLISAGKLIQALVNNGLSMLLGYIGWGISGLIAGWVISQFINVLVLSKSVNWNFARHDLNGTTFTETLKAYKDFPLINSLHAFMDIFVNQFLLFLLISRYFGQLELGLFSTMNKYVRAPILLISSSVSQLYYVEGSKLINQQQSVWPVFVKTLRLTLLFALPFSLVVWFFGPDLFEWYLGKKWILAGEYAQLLAPMLLIYFLVSPVSGTPVLFGKQQMAFVISLLGYSAIFGGMFVGIVQHWNFREILMIYMVGFSIYYLLNLSWYIYLIRKV